MHGICTVLAKLWGFVHFTDTEGLSKKWTHAEQEQMKAALSTGHSVIFIFPYRYKSESVLCLLNLESFQYDYNDFQLLIYLACYAHFSPSWMLVRCTRAEVSWCRNWRVNKLWNSILWLYRALRLLATRHLDGAPSTDSKIMFVKENSQRRWLPICLECVN